MGTVLQIDSIEWSGKQGFAKGVIAQLLQKKPHRILNATPFPISFAEAVGFSVPNKAAFIGS